MLFSRIFNIRMAVIYVHYLRQVPFGIELYHIYHSVALNVLCDISELQVYGHKPEPAKYVLYEGLTAKHSKLLLMDTAVFRV